MKLNVKLFADGADKLGIIEEIGQLETSVVIATKKNSSVAPLDYKKEIILKK